jgi:TonB-linked SusC/RagA family outer membrane protein
MRKILTLLTALALCAVMAHGQSRTVTGQIKDSKGDPIPFATIKIKGTETGSAADANGNFSITAQQGAVLLISASGYTDAEAKVSATGAINVSLRNAEAMQEVVVTAMGVTRQKRSIGYAAQQISSEKLSTTKMADLNTALAGKVAGVQIRSGSGAKFGSSSIRLRGVNTLGGGNPIYVLDGVITSASGINPDDVESLTVLKGPAATALYGQRGSEGAVVITSKKGKKNGIGVELNHTTTFERVYILPKYQNEYGGGTSQEWSTFTFDPATMPANLSVLNGAKYYRYDVDESWGPKLDGTTYAPWYAWDPTDPEFGKQKPFVAQKNNVRDFFETGIANNTTVSLSKVTAESNTRFSFTNLTRTGVMPNSKQQKNWLVFTNSINLTNAFTLSTNVNYVYENLFNVPQEGYNTQTTGSFNQWFHRDLEINKLKRYKRPDGTFTTWNITSPTNLATKFWDNPYTEVYENISHNYVQRLFGNAIASYKLGHGFKVSAIVRGNFTNTNGDARVASYTLNTESFSTSETKFRETNFLGTIDYENTFGDFSVKGSVYGELMKQEQYNVTAATSGGFILRNVYNVSNSLNEKNATNFMSTRKVNSLYGYASVGYKNLLFVDVNLRNDISSSLPKDNNSYVYGGVATSFVFSELLHNKSILSFGKIRASIATTGTDIGAYNIFETYPLGTNYVKPTGSNTVTYSAQTVPNQRPNDRLEPTLSTSYEIGTELQFLGNRARMDFNYYFREAKGQIIPVAVPGSTGYTTRLINAGNIRNYGYELTLGGTPIRNKDWNWDIDFNLGINKNKVIQLADDVDNIQTALDGSNITFGFVGSPGVSLNARVNQPYGMIIGNGIVKNADGRPLINDDGYYVTKENMELGTILPDFTGGLASSLTYKNFYLGFSLDFQKGGRFISTSKMFTAGSGLGAETAGLNDKGKPKRDDVAAGGGVKLEGVNQTTGKENEVYVNTRDLYESQLFSVWEKWMYDASYIKLRELSIGYNFPKSMYRKLPIQDMRFSIIGQNLWLISSKIDGFDPSELEQSWMEGGQLPGTRTIGFNLKLTF